MEDYREKIQEYVNKIGKITGKSINVNFDGLLCVVNFNGQIVYTSAGGFEKSRYQAVETFLGGLLMGMVYVMSSDLEKKDSFYSLRN